MLETTRLAVRAWLTGAAFSDALVDILPFALGQHVQIIELYVEDLLVAYDPSNPRYPRHHEEYQKVYESAVRVLGGS
jgi:hypothetical protein